VVCAQALPPDAPQKPWTGRYELDITAPSSGAPGLEVTHTLHTYVDCQCGCGHWTRAKPGRCADEEGWTVELTELCEASHNSVYRKEEIIRRKRATF